MQANLHHNRPRVPQILRAFLVTVCIACICTIWSELKRGNEVELADLTRGMRKNDFLEPEQLFFAKPGLSEFHVSSAEKNVFLEHDLFFKARRV